MKMNDMVQVLSGYLGNKMQTGIIIKIDETEACVHFGKISGWVELRDLKLISSN